MKTIEAAVVLGLDEKEVLYWHLPPNRHSGGIPDSQELWEVFWENRLLMSGQAHSHPGFGWPGPSWEDITTYEVNELCLGRRYKWWIASMDRLVVVEWLGPKSTDYKVTRLSEEPPWVIELRRFSQPTETQSNEKEIQP
jgi:hypothetical protein